MPSQQDIAQKKLRQEPRNRPLFLPTTKPHPLNTLTYGLPPMYWLGTSRWCPSPLCKFHSVYVCFLLAFTPFLLLLHCLVLLCVLVCVYPLWCEGCMSFLDSCSIPFIPSWVGYCPGKSLCLHSKIRRHVTLLLRRKLGIACLRWHGLWQSHQKGGAYIYIYIYMYTYIMHNAST